jgi:hypothetical protein
MDACYIEGKSLAIMVPAEAWKTENVSNQLVYLVKKISR